MGNVPYRVIRSDRKTVALEITRGGDVVVRAPRRMSDAQIARFISEKSAWLEKHLQSRAAQPKESCLTVKELEILAARAAQIIPPRVEHFAQRVGVAYGRIAIRRQHTRWGSCSSKGNLNFNCLLLLAPSEVLDYVIVHELCHRKELNHSVRFWAEVARVMPDYKQHEQWLKTNGPALIRRLETI